MRIAPGGLRLSAAAIVLAIAMAIAGFVLPAIAIGTAAIAIVLFYRDPERRPVEDGYVAAADGRIRAIESTDEDRVRIVTFLNLWDVHVVRSPWDGQVTATDRVRGGRRPAFVDSALGNAGVDVGFGESTVALRAGLVARRVRTYVDPGDVVARGDRLGHIAFGSRVDVILPTGIDLADVTVGQGDRVTAGETVIAPAVDGSANGSARSRTRDL